MSTPSSRREKTALLTGTTGQDGAYLSELLLAKGYQVHGVKRRASSFNTDRVDHLYQDPHEEAVRFHLHYGDLTDSTNLIRIIQEVQPDEIYNLGAQSHVQVSFETPEYTAGTDGLGRFREPEDDEFAGLIRPLVVRAKPPASWYKDGTVAVIVHNKPLKELIITKLDAAGVVGQLSQTLLGALI